MCDQAATALAGTGADVDDVVGAADGVFVVFDHHQGVAFVAQFVQSVEQDLIVAGVQADRRFVQHVANALQVAAQLRSQADALSLAAGQGGSAAVQREVAQAHIFQELQTALDFRDQVAGDVGLAGAHAADQGHALYPGADVTHTHAGDGGDGPAGVFSVMVICCVVAVTVRAKAHRAGGGVQAGACAGGAGDFGHVFDLGFGKGFFAAFVFVIGHRVVINLALVFGELDAGAHAIGAPTVLAVVREQTRIELGIGGGAHRAGPQRRERLQAANVRGGCECRHGFLQARQIAEHMDHAFAELQRLRQGGAQGGFVAGADIEAGHGQLDGVLLETVDARKTQRGQKVAVHTQVRIALGAGPIGQLGVNAFAIHHQGREQADVLAFEVFEQLRDDAVWRLRLHRCAVVQAMLGAQFDVEQAQKVPHLGGGAHGGLAAPTGQALFNGHRRRNAVHRVHLGPSGGLHDAAGVGVQAFKVTALAFVEQDVKSQCGFARTTDAGDDVELATRYVDAQALEVVLFGVDDLDRVRAQRFPAPQRCRAGTG